MVFAVPRQAESGQLGRSSAQLLCPLSLAAPALPRPHPAAPAAPQPPLQEGKNRRVKAGSGYGSQHPSPAQPGLGE